MTSPRNHDSTGQSRGETSFSIVQARGVSSDAIDKQSVNKNYTQKPKNSLYDLKGESIKQRHSLYQREQDRPTRNSLKTSEQKMNPKHVADWWKLLAVFNCMCRGITRHVLNRKLVSSLTGTVATISRPRVFFAYCCGVWCWQAEAEVEVCLLEIDSSFPRNRNLPERSRVWPLSGTFCLGCPLLPPPLPSPNY